MILTRGEKVTWETENWVKPNETTWLSNETPECVIYTVK